MMTEAHAPASRWLKAAPHSPDARQRRIEENVRTRESSFAVAPVPPEHLWVRALVRTRLSTHSGLDYPLNPGRERSNLPLRNFLTSSLLTLLASSNSSGL